MLHELSIKYNHFNRVISGDKSFQVRKDDRDFFCGDYLLLKEINQEGFMNERDFVYWLQGFFEMTNVENLTKEQVKMIKDHLSLVMEKKTPQLGAPTPIATPTQDWPLTPIVTCSSGSGSDSGGFIC